MNNVSTRRLAGSWLAIGALTMSVIGCGISNAESTADSWESMEVTATSFTLAEEETKRGDIGLTAFGDELKPGAKAIAVSRDLIKQGLTHGTKIHIEGLPGTYTVRDKMNRRWHDKIDILFARQQKARNWGRQTVEIEYQVADAG